MIALVGACMLGPDDECKAQMLEVEAAYNASLQQASEKLPASIDQLMYGRGFLCEKLGRKYLFRFLSGRSLKSPLYCYRCGALNSITLVLCGGSVQNVRLV